MHVKSSALAALASALIATLTGLSAAQAGATFSHREVWDSRDPVDVLMTQEAPPQTPKEIPAAPIDQAASAPWKSFAACSISSSKPLEIEVLFPSGSPAQDLGIFIDQSDKKRAALRIAVSLSPNETERDPKIRVIRIKSREKNERLQDILIDQGSASGKILRLGKADARAPGKFKSSGPSLSLDYSPHSRTEISDSSSHQGLRKHSDFAIYCLFPD